MQKDSRIVHLSSVASHLNKFSSSLAERYRSASSIADVDSLVAEFEQASQDGSAKSGGWPDPYSVSKASINAMTRIQAKENPDIKINCCCPGTSRDSSLTIYIWASYSSFRVVQLRHGWAAWPTAKDTSYVPVQFPSASAPRLTIHRRRRKDPSQARCW